MSKSKHMRKSKRKTSRIHTIVKTLKFIFDFLQLLKNLLEFFH